MAASPGQCGVHGAGSEKNGKGTANGTGTEKGSRPRPVETPERQRTATADPGDRTPDARPLTCLSSKRGLACPPHARPREAVCREPHPVGAAFPGSSPEEAGNDARPMSVPPCRSGSPDVRPPPHQVSCGRAAVVLRRRSDPSALSLPGVATRGGRAAGTCAAPRSASPVHDADPDGSTCHDVRHERPQSCPRHRRRTADDT